MIVNRPYFVQPSKRKISLHHDIFERFDVHDDHRKASGPPAIPPEDMMWIPFGQSAVVSWPALRLKLN